MFGKGVYLADTSSKSANYCHSDNSDKKDLLKYFLFLTDPIPICPRLRGSEIEVV
jgi:hypothetical protein